jgi:exonuclease III
MKIMSFNVHGVRGTLKRLALRRMIFLRRPDVALHQESMDYRTKSIECLSTILPN